MVYLAGDNDLEVYGYQDLGEMSAVGSSADVAVVAQFDSMLGDVTRRYYITAGHDPETDCVAELPEVNTGDPAALIDFVSWACQAYPAKRYALVLWNHGAGWKDTDIYQIAEARGVAERVTRGQVRGLARGRVSRALFSTSLERLVVAAVETERAILFDDSSADFLDNLELRQVLEAVVRRIGQPLDLLGFDACLMNMLEVHYQVRDLCRLVVGSQENEPGDGWPYDEILARLTENPDMTPEELGRTIVRAYVGYYRANHPGLSVTQSVVSLAGLESVAGAVSDLAKALVNSLGDRGSLGLLFGALRSAQSFTDRDYVDLAHFCHLLSEAEPEGQIPNAARRVVDLLVGSSSPLVAEAHSGPDVGNASGLSIYLPVRVLSPLYAKLSFARQHAWDEFLEAFVHPN
jgi:hypothetical protein